MFKKYLKLIKINYLLMDENNEQFINDFSSSNLGDSKKELPMKKYIIIGVISLIAIFVGIIIIIIVTKNLSNKNSPEQMDNLPEIGVISCIYDISQEIKETKILGEDFNKISNFDIFINGNKINYSKAYEFNTFGSTKIEFKLYENINMDYMFKGVDSLISVKMNSVNNAKIISMISTFENCKNLEIFSIIRFNTIDIKSLK